MGGYFDDVIQRIHEQRDGCAADNSEAGLTGSLRVSWGSLSIDNPLVQRALGSSKFKEYFDKWYVHWTDKSLDGKVQCFEAALVSYIGYLFKDWSG